jgi:hypothetical protein
MRAMSRWHVYALSRAGVPRGQRRKGLAHVVRHALVFPLGLLSYLLLLLCPGEKGVFEPCWVPGLFRCVGVGVGRGRVSVLGLLSDSPWGEGGLVLIGFLE